MAESVTQTDIAIVGGGMVGTPLALALAARGWQVTLLDAAQDNPSKGGLLDQRCTAISAGSVELLNALDLWQAVAKDANPIKKVHVSQRGHFGTARMNAEQHKLDALGYVVNNQHYLAALRDLLRGSSVEHIRGARALSYASTGNSAKPNGAVVAYEADKQNSSLEAKLVVAIDGVASTMREAVGIGIKHHDYEQFAVLGCVELDQPHNDIAYERFSAGGPLAMLPRPDNIASFVYCIDAKQHAVTTSADDATFLNIFQKEFGSRLGDFGQVGERLTIPLTRIEAQMQQRDRLLLLGNAMRLIHPVAGQGYNLAMRDIAGLLNTLDSNSRDNACDPGDAQLLSSFVASRTADQQRVVRLTDTLARGFRGYAGMPGHLRGAGLLAMAAVPLFEQEFTRQSLGFVSPMPAAVSRD